MVLAEARLARLFFLLRIKECKLLHYVPMT
jgi:hypothetical protein